MRVPGTFTAPPQATHSATPLSRIVESGRGDRGTNAPNAMPDASSPEGTLWALLSPEEQEFFLKLQAEGQLTYGRALSATEPQPPGARLDVRA